MSSSAAWVSALTGLRLRLPHSFIQISARMSVMTGALKPARFSVSARAATRARPRIVDLGEREPIAFDDA